MPVAPQPLNACCCCARQAGASWGSAALWLLLGCLLTAACWAAGAVALRTHRRRHSAVQAAAEASWDEPALQALLQDNLPAWLADPQMVRQPEWLNAAVATLWPHISSTVSRQASAGGQLEKQLNSTAVWRPRFLTGAYVHLQGVHLGQAPPRITAVKAVRPQDGGGGGGGVQEELAFDCSFAWSSRMEVKLLVSLLPEQQAELQNRVFWLRHLWSLVSRAIVVKIGVRNAVLRGTLRLTLAPLLGDLPLVGAARLSLLGMPAFSYNTTLLGGNPFAVPGLEAWINSFVRSKALAPLLFPQSLLLPLPGAPAAPQRQPPEGLLEVRVVQATNVPRMDWLGGKADPFVRLWVREESKFRTSVKSSTLTPVWDEQFTLIVHSVQFQTLTLVLYDSETWLPDEEIGRAEVALSSLDLSPGARNDLQLRVVPPYRQQHSRRALRRASLAPLPAAALGDSMLGTLRGQASLQGDSWLGALPAPADAGRSGAAGATPGVAAVAGREDTARGSALLQRSHSGQGQGTGGTPAAAAARRSPMDQLRRLSAVPAALASAMGGGGAKECQLHVQCSFSAFTRAEVEAATSAGTPGIVNILRRLSRQSKVPALLRSGVLGMYLDRAEGLASRAGFTKNYKVRISVGPRISRVTERGKGALMHKTSPVFDESLELLIDGDTASAEGTLVSLEIWAVHFLRKDKFKGRASVPLREVQRRRRVRGSWPLQDAPPGASLSLELSWTAAVGMY